MKIIIPYLTICIKENSENIILLIDSLNKDLEVLLNNESDAIKKLKNSYNNYKSLIKNFL